MTIWNENDDLEQMGFIEDTETGLMPYSGRSTRGNRIIDGYLADYEKSLENIAEAISDMNRAHALVEDAWYNREYRITKATEALNRHFEKQGEWDEKSVTAAIVAFEKCGFRSKRVKDFIAFVRGMFFDDSNEAFRSIDCIGLSSFRRRSFIFAGVTFEDSKSGNQFEIVLPFTVKEKREYNGLFYYKNCYEPCVFLDSVVSDPRIRDMPCYVLTAPDKEGISCEVSKNYDIRTMRVAVEKFVMGGCVYLRRNQTRTY